MSEEGTGAAFAAELAALKRRGSALLVRSDGAGADTCLDLLGSREERRRRVLVRADEFEPLPVPGEDAVVVDATASDARSAAAAEPAAYEPDPGDRFVAGGCHAETVATAVRNEVERAADAGLETGELRVCLGSLGPLLERDDPDAVAGAFEDVLAVVRANGGMGHVHLPPDVDGAVVDRLEGMADVTVRTRTTPGGVHQQRWHLHDADLDTGWLQMQVR